MMYTILYISQVCLLFINFSLVQTPSIHSGWSSNSQYKEVPSVQSDDGYEEKDEKRTFGFF